MTTLKSSRENKFHYLFVLLLTLIFVFFTQFSVLGAGRYFLRGIVRDADSLEPLPLASVKSEANSVSTLTDDKGIFELTVPDTTSTLVISCLGYDTRNLKIKKNNVNLYDVMLTPSTTMLDEVVVKRQKYSKKNNPAVDFAVKLRNARDLTDPRRNDYYNYNVHELITFALNDFGTKEDMSALYKRFPFLWEHVDTSEISGKPILNVLVKEKLAEVHYRNSPNTEKEIITAERQEGLDEMADQQNVLTLMQDFLPEIDLYKNDIDILHNKFVSPLSRIAPDFYKFYLTDTVEVGNEKCIVLSFYPRNPQTFGFNGQVYVVEGDSTMFIKKVEMRTPRSINLNFIESLLITQEFKRAPDGSRIKDKDDITVELAIVPGSQGVYIRRNMAFNKHDFDKWYDTSVYDMAPKRVYTANAKMRPKEFWDDLRMLALSDNEKGIDQMMTQLRGVPLFYWAEKALKILFMGYVNTGNPSKIDLGPVNTLMSFNSVDGVRLRVGGITTANLSKRWFGRLYLAYGTKDRKWKYGAELEYSFNDKEYHSREFPVHSLRLNSTYDIDNIGQHYLYTSQDNIFVSFQRMSSHNSIYHWENKLSYSLELHNNFSIYADLQNDKRVASHYVKFINGYNQSYEDYCESGVKIQLRYAPGEKFFQQQSQRIPVNRNAPVFTIAHTIAPKGVLGSTFMVNKTEVGFEKRFWLSAFGYIDTEVKGGHVWSRSAFPDLLIPNTNLSYTIQRGSFSLMNPMEFINDSYASLSLDYWLNGALFNYIPIIKKLKLREVVTFKGLYGHLSKKNNPEYHPELFRFPAESNAVEMKGTPYMELSAGIDNIFKVLRVDYIWRLTYLNVPYKIDRRGLRIALHMRF